MISQSVFDHFIDFEAWKCLNCGNVIVKKEKTIEFDSFSVFYQQERVKKKNKK
jgi:hypothetical protein